MVIFGKGVDLKSMKSMKSITFTLECLKGRNTVHPDVLKRFRFRI